jgi:hypothetical protein
MFMTKRRTATPLKKFAANCGASLLMLAASATKSLKIFSSWTSAGLPAGLHVYERGSHVRAHGGGGGVTSLRLKELT